MTNQPEAGHSVERGALIEGALGFLAMAATGVVYELSNPVATVATAIVGAVMLMDGTRRFCQTGNRPSSSDIQRY